MHLISFELHPIKFYNYYKWNASNINQSLNLLKSVVNYHHNI